MCHDVGSGHVYCRFLLDSPFGLLFMLEWPWLKPISSGTWVFVDSIGMSSILARHRHFGCILIVDFGCSVHLLGGIWLIGYVFMVSCCTGFGGCSIWVDVHCMTVCLSTQRVCFSGFFFVDVVSFCMVEDGILCCAMAGIPSTLVLLVLVPTN